MTKLRISPDLSLPIEAVTEAIGFLGRRGSGKSYAAQKLAEEFHRARAQFVVLDPVGNWWALRLAANGTDPGLPITIFGGLQGDLPIEPTAGKMIADVIVDRGISAVIDVSQFESDADKARFARAFCERFYFRKKSAPSAVHLFLEEAQEFIPQNPAGGKGEANESHMLHAFTRLAKLGRNFGIGVSMLSQRPQEVNKKVLNLTELLFVFQLTGSHERKAVETWIGDKGIEGEDIEAELPKLERGQPHAWSPAWLKVSSVIEIGKKWTFDASSTPKVGAQTVVRELSPIDLEQLRKDMAASVERAKADDPKELRKEIATLRTQLTKAQKSPAATVEKIVAVVDQRAIDRAVVAAARAQAGTIKSLRDALDVAMKFIINISTKNFDVAGVDKAELERAVQSAMAKATELVDRKLSARTKEMDELRLAAQRVAEKLKRVLSADAEDVVIDVAVTRNEPFSVSPSPAGRNGDGPARRAISRPPRATSSNGDGGHLSGARLKIARGLAELEAIGVAQAKRAQLSFYAGLTFSGGYGSNTLGAMRTEGLLDYPTDGYVMLTAAGRAAAGEIDPPDSLDDLHARVRRHLSGLEERIFDAVVALGRGGSITREELAETVGATFSGGYGSNTLGALRTAGIVDYPEKGTVGPSDLLFPEGLR